MPVIATAEINAKYTDKKEVETSAGRHLTDFVWAVRLTEVSTSLFSSDLSQKVVTKGTVFAPDSSNIDAKAVKAVFAEEGWGREGVDALEVSKGVEQQFLVTIDGI